LVSPTVAPSNPPKRTAGQPFGRQARDCSFEVADDMQRDRGFGPLSTTERAAGSSLVNLCVFPTIVPHPQRNRDGARFFPPSTKQLKAILVNSDLFRDIVSSGALCQRASNRMSASMDPITPPGSLQNADVVLQKTLTPVLRNRTLRARCNNSSRARNVFCGTRIPFHSDSSTRSNIRRGSRELA
jgi:hypothetical protein